MTSAPQQASKVPRSDLTRQKLIEAGIELFSSIGYEGTSTRQAEAVAGVQRNLINYHFGSKEQFWKDCMSALFGRMTAALAEVEAAARDLSATERLRFLVRRYVRASAANPEVTRIMFDAGRRDDWRLAWLVENYTRDFYEQVCRTLREGVGRAAEISPTQFYYALVSSAAIFAMAPECRLLAGEDPHSLVEAQAEAMVTLLTGVDGERT